MLDSFRGVIPLDRLYHPEYDLWILPEDDETVKTPPCSSLIPMVPDGRHGGNRITGCATWTGWTAT